MKILLVAVFSLILSSSCFKCYSAFPVKKQAIISVQINGQYRGSQDYTTQPAPVNNDKEERGGSAALSFVLGGVSLGLVAVLFKAANANLLLTGGIGLIAGLLAIFFGTKGLDRKYRGFACAGLVLGIIGVAAHAALLILALVLSSI